MIIRQTPSGKRIITPNHIRLNEFSNIIKNLPLTSRTVKLALITELDLNSGKNGAKKEKKLANF